MRSQPRQGSDSGETESRGTFEIDRGNDPATVMKEMQICVPDHIVAISFVLTTNEKFYFRPSFPGP
jgi:hypothetical protein